MKCIILAAGPTLGGSYMFPPNSKPKCLFHYEGEVILEHTVNVLRKCGVADVIVVTGYKNEMIEQFNKERGLGLTLIHNPAGASDRRGSGWREGYKSIRLGLKGIDEDVIITVGDLWLMERGFFQLLGSKERLIIGRGGHGLQMFKIGREYLPKLRLARGRGCVRLLYRFCMVEKGAKGFHCENNVYTGIKGQRQLVKGYYLELKGIRDIDWYWQTDEGIAAGAKKRT